VNALLHDYRIRQVKLSPALLLPESTPLDEAVRRMREMGVGCLVTSAGEKLTGIFTERDLVQRVLGRDVDWKAPIAGVSTRELVTLRSDEPLRKGLFLMRKRNFRHIPVFDGNDRLQGVLSIRNVIDLLAEHFPTEVMNLPPGLDRIPPATSEGA
jgi:CBS domain-containing protein